MKQTIAVLNQKGGVGKTTTTLNLGAYLAKAGRSVLIVDMDPQGNATSGLGIDKQSLPAIMYDVLFGEAKPQDIIKMSSSGSLQILPSSSKLAAAEIDTSISGIESAIPTTV